MPEPDLNSLSLNLPRFNQKSLIARACRAHNEQARHQAQQLDDLFAEVKTVTPHDAPQRVAQVSLNYLLALCERQHPDLACLRGQPAEFETYARFKSWLLDRIALTYPWLAEACERQRPL